MPTTGQAAHPRRPRPQQAPEHDREFAMEAILEHRDTPAGGESLFKGRDGSATWEADKNLKNGQPSLRAYYPGRPRKDLLLRGGGRDGR